MPLLTGFRATFRCLRDVEMDFTSPEDGTPSPFIAMVGANGAGKTTVLEAIAQSVFLIVRRDTGWGFLREGEYVGFGCSEPPVGFDLQATAVKVLLADGRHVKIDSQGRWRVVERAGSFGASGELPGQVSSLMPESLKRTLYIGSGYLPVMPAGKHLEQGPVRGMNLNLALLPRDAHGMQQRTDAVHQWWLHLHWEYPKTTTLDRLWTALKPFLGELVYAGVNPADHLPWFDDRGARVSFNELSSGQRRLILLFLEIVMHCGEDGLVLFDEPEAHLHPAWQQALPDALCQLVPRGQVIVATHAPHIVHGRPAHQVFVLGGLPWERDHVVE